jgi:hypothetical protein
MNTAATSTLDTALNNRFAVLTVRVLMIVLPVMLTLCAGLVTWMFQDIRATQAQQGKELQKVTSDVQVLNAKLDNGLIWRITEIERRLSTVEQGHKP